MAVPPPWSPQLLQRASRVTTLIADVDGVLTDGRIVYAEYGD
ncbi:MAG: 3-deoxy-D-manno-octulosonate 8-phosphate phosphatase, partial [Candidatus Omnitrophica bacterium]|nr:3-deoxy-D-manno-octulosonate 8-phosphate phosphatase [Candidatus Omnitrophota bacterium]